MNNISNIEINGVTYAVKDTTAREALKNCITEAEVDSKISEIGNPLPLESGTGENSIKMISSSENINFAVGNNSSVFGCGLQAGMLGYYYSNIEFGSEIFDENNVSTATYGPCVINLTKEQNIAPTESFNIGFSIGDIISIINGSKYPNCATIINIESNIITVDSLPFSIVKTPTDIAIDDFSIFVSNKPNSGEVILGHYSHAEGENSIALERGSHAEGRATLAYGQYSHAEGRETKAGYCSHAEGRACSADGEHSHAEGYSTKATGTGSHAEGRACSANGQYSHAEGYSTSATGKYSHAEGQGSSAVGERSHAEGNTTTATGAYSHAEGYSTSANGISSHAEGRACSATGAYSHAEGYSTSADGDFSHTEGHSTKALGNCSHVEGKYNIIDNKEKYAHILGNGTSDTLRSNAHTIDWSGNAWFAGDITFTTPDGTSVSVYDMANTISTMQTYIETLESKITALESKITELEGKIA